MKFFDVIIPVVPFLTSSNAREMLSEEEIINTRVSGELIKLSAPYLTDMRLIKNIRNEFLIFRERVIKLDEEKEHDDKVFAMVLYKNRNLIDFEEMIRGEGKIDKIYKAFRDIVNQNLKDQRRRRQKILEKLPSLENSEEGTEDIEILDGKIRFLEDSGLRMADLWDKDFTVLKEREEHEGKSFSEIVLGYFGDEVETRLIQRGYINENYMFYSAIYPDNRFSIPARRFLIHQVGRGEMDPNFSLRTEDVKAILEECVASDLGNPGLFNVSIIDYLLEKEWDLWLKYFFNALSGKFKEQAQDFLNSYFNGKKGGHPEKLIQKLTPAWMEILDFIASKIDIGTETKVKFLDIALENLSVDKKYIVTDELAQQLKENYRELKAFTSDSTSTEIAAKLVDLLKRGEVLLESLSELGVEVKKALVAKSLYTVTRNNLEEALGNERESLALDSIKSNAPIVYDHVLNNILDYLVCIERDSTIESNKFFVQIINEIHDKIKGEEARNILTEVISGAISECCVEDLRSVPAEIWAILVQNKCVKVNFNNVNAYAEKIGKIDQGLANLLTSSNYVVDDLEDADEEAKKNLALVLLKAREVLPDPTQRVKIVESFDLENRLVVESVPIEDGNLFGLLLEKGIIPDESESFEAIKNCGWKTREFFIGKSNKIKNYVKPEYIRKDEIMQALRSGVIPNDVKVEIVGMLPEYGAIEVKELEKIACYVLEGNALRSLKESGMQYFAASSVNKELKVKLLAQALSQPENDKSFNKTLPKILQSIGRRYADIAIRNGRKIKIPNTTDNEIIIKKLKAINIVSSSSVKGRNIQVNMKRC